MKYKETSYKWLDGTVLYADTNDKLYILKEGTYTPIGKTINDYRRI